MNKLAFSVTQGVSKLKFPHIIRENTARPLRYLAFGLRWGALALLVAITVVRLNLLDATAIPSSIWRPLSAMGASLANAPGFGAVLGVATGSNEEAAAQKRAELEASLAFWQDIAKAHPDYKDAHLMVASLAYQLGRDDEARLASSRALALDPNDQAAQDIRELLEENTN